MTGASGFVGRHLVERWRAHRIHALGRTAVDGTIHIPSDLVDGIDLARLPRRIDAVVHLATSQAGPRATFRVNSAATLDLLEAAASRGAGRFLLASTGGVYGWRYDDADEDTSPAPADLYSHCKLIAEELVRSYRDAMATTVLRLYMPYGADQSTRLFADLVRRVRDALPVVIAGEGVPILNPIHIDDLVEVFDRALERPGHALLNVGGREALSIRDMAEEIARALDRPAVFAHVERPEGPGRLVGRIDRLRAWLGHDPRVTFSEGVARSLPEGSVSGR